MTAYKPSLIFLGQVSVGVANREFDNLPFFFFFFLPSALVGALRGSGCPRALLACFAASVIERLFGSY